MEEREMKKASYKLIPARVEFMRANRIVNIWFNQKSVIKRGGLTTAAIKGEVNPHPINNQTSLF